MTLYEAREFRRLLNTVIADLDDETAESVKVLYPNWAAGVDYVVGDKRNYNGVLYKCLQAHTSQESWNPEDAHSLWAKVLNPEGDIPVWEQPSAENAYMTGDKVHYKTIDDPVYESLIDNNVWSPEAYPQGWRQLLTGETTEETTEE